MNNATLSSSLSQLQNISDTQYNLTEVYKLGSRVIRVPCGTISTDAEWNCHPEDALRSRMDFQGYPIRTVFAPFIPLSFLGEDGDFKGIFPDLFGHIVQFLNLTPSYSVSPDNVWGSK